MAALSVALITMPFSITLCHISLITYLICWVFEGQWNEKILILKGSTMLHLILVFGIMQLIGMSYTESASDGWFSLEKKIFLFLIPVALATSSIKLEQKEIRWIFYSFMAACLVGTFVCVYSAMAALQMDQAATSGQISYFDFSLFKNLNPDVSDRWLFFSYVSLANGISIHPTYFSLYLTFCCAFLLHELITQSTLSGRLRIALGVVLFYFTLFVICLSSRIMIFSLITIYVIVAGNMIFKRQLRMYSVFLMVFVTIILFVTYLNPVSRYRSWQELQLTPLTVQEHSVYKTSTGIRASLWWLGWKTFVTNNILWGAGTGDVEAALKKVSAKYGITNILNSFDPHNQYLYILIAHGVIGFAIFMMMAALFFIPAWIHKYYLMLAFGFLFGALFLTETALELQKGIAFFALVFSLLTFQWQSFQTHHFPKRFFSARS